MEAQERWQDWAILVFGVWLVFAPLFTGYASPVDAAALNAYATGAAVAGFSASALWSPRGRSRSEKANLVLGVWLIAAPFLLGFHAREAAAAWHQVILGVLIGGDSVLALAARAHAGPQLHQGERS